MKPPFEAVVARHGPTVLRVCTAVLGPQDAQDAWSETFLAALRAYPELPADADLTGWLVTIAHRKALDGARARGRRPVPQAEPPDGKSRLGVWQPAETELWSRLRSLPPKQRAAVAYHHLAGLPYAEVATLLGGTEVAARRAAADGIAALRRAFAPPAEPVAASPEPNAPCPDPVEGPPTPPAVRGADR